MNELFELLKRSRLFVNYNYKSTYRTNTYRHMKNTDFQSTTASNIIGDRLTHSQVITVDESVEIVFKSPNERDHENLRD